MADGRVYLVGAGPGDPGLLTLRGLEVLKGAQVVLYDRLIDRRILEFAPASAERIFVGKDPCPGHHCRPQSATNEILIAQARAGKKVVRLKGGDPLLFARGAEELEALAAAGIAYEIVPGVTAALAAAATAAIPLTHREHSSAVAFITGHEDPAKTPTLDWPSLARFPGTLVIYMGFSRFPILARELVARGKDPATPIAYVEWCGTNRQQVVESDLARAATADPPPLRSPVLVVIGPVARLRTTLEWFEQRPLFGQTILVTRPTGQADPLIARLETLGAQVLHEPGFAIEDPLDWSPVDAALGRLADYDWLVFTSPNGVERFLTRLFRLGHDLRRLGRCRLAAIGTGTAEALGRFHLKADLVPAEFRSEQLAQELAPVVAGKRILLIRADRGRAILFDQLRAADAQVESIAVYRQVDRSVPSAPTAAALEAGRIDWVLLSSSNLATVYAGWLGATPTGRAPRIVSISPVTSRTVRELGLAVAAEARAFTIEGMIEALLSAVGSKLEPGLDGLPKNQAAGQQHDDVGGDAETAEGDAGD